MECESPHIPQLFQIQQCLRPTSTAQIAAGVSRDTIHIPQNDRELVNRKLGPSSPAQSAIVGCWRCLFRNIPSRATRSRHYRGTRVTDRSLPFLSLGRDSFCGHIEEITPTCGCTWGSSNQQGVSFGCECDCGRLSEWRPTRSKAYPKDSRARRE